MPITIKLTLIYNYVSSSLLSKGEKEKYYNIESFILIDPKSYDFVNFYLV